MADFHRGRPSVVGYSKLALPGGLFFSSVMVGILSRPLSPFAIWGVAVLINLFRDEGD
jgi:hypothetical protein